MIPARYKSSRFPGKPLADICGKPLIWWVYRQAIKVTDFEKVYVATDDERIASACDNLNIPTVLTSESHQTGTDRVGEVARKIKADVYVNIQGDEPLLRPAMIKSTITPILKHRGISVTNLMTEIARSSDLMNSTVPKVVVNARKEAVFLSRLPIPYPKNPNGVKYYKQVCVYGFTRKALTSFCGLSRGPVEIAEDIELLRFIENDIKVQMVGVWGDTVAVDTPSDLDFVRDIISKKKL